jgi:hypothetical protein
VEEKYLSQLQQCIHSCGLNLHIIDVDIFAVKRAMPLIIPTDYHNIPDILGIIEKSDYLLAYGLAMRKANPW